MDWDFLYHPIPSESAPPTISRREEVPRPDEAADTTPEVSSVDHTSVVRKLKPEEVELLKKSSYINKQLFLPWMDSDRLVRTIFVSPFISFVRAIFGMWS